MHVIILKSRRGETQSKILIHHTMKYKLKIYVFMN